MDTNNDFLSQKGDRQVRTNKKDNKPSKEELVKYSEYYSMSEYSRKCLPATNYWRVMNGLKEIPVPKSDIHYHKYFDKRCYDEAPKHQKMKALERGDEIKIEKESPKPVETKNVVEEPEVIKEEVIIEKNPESEKDVVIEKQTEVSKEPIFSKIEPEKEKEIIPDPIVKNDSVKKKKSVPKQNDDSQFSLF